MAAHSRAPQPSLEFQEHTARLNTLLSTRTLGRGIVSDFPLFLHHVLIRALCHPFGQHQRSSHRRSQTRQKNTKKWCFSDMLGFAGSYPGPDTGNLSATTESCENRLEFLKSAPSAKLAVTSGNCIWGEENKR